MIKAEIYQDKALLLDQWGNVRQVTSGFDGQPCIQCLAKVSVRTRNSHMEPQLARYVKEF